MSKRCYRREEGLMRSDGQLVIGEPIQIIVNHKRSLSERIDEGRYDLVHPCVTSFIDVSTEIEIVSVRLVHFGIQRFVGCHWPDIAGFAPATLSHLLSLGVLQPNLQRQFPIVATGSSARVVLPEHAGCGTKHDQWTHVVPCLGRRQTRRQFCLHSEGTEWRRYYRFLVLDNT